MKIQYLQESVFGTYKNKRSDDEKLKNVRKETAQISNKWFQENVVNEILDYYVPLMIDYSKSVSTKERGITLLFDRAKDKINSKSKGLVVEISEIAGKIIIRQYVKTDECRSYGDLYFLENETFTIFDEIEEYILENFGPCEIILVNCETEGGYWYNTENENSNIKEVPFLRYNSQDIKEIIFGLKDITSLTPIFKFLNRFEDSLPNLYSISFTNCNNLESFKSEVPLKLIKVERISLWGCKNLKSFDGWENFMNKDNPVVVYNINSILNNTGHGADMYTILSEFNTEPAVFELATKGKIQKKYIQYLGELKKKQAEHLNDLLRRKSEDVDYDVEGANITFLEYNLKTEKVKQYDHDPKNME